MRELFERNLNMRILRLTIEILSQPPAQQVVRKRIQIFVWYSPFNRANCRRLECAALGTDGFVRIDELTAAQSFN